jgi:hypothetical protein
MVKEEIIRGINITYKIVIITEFIQLFFGLWCQKIIRGINITYKNDIIFVNVQTR